MPILYQFCVRSVSILCLHINARLTEYQQNTNKTPTENMSNDFLNFQRMPKGKRMVLDLSLFAESDIAIVKLMSHLNFYGRVQPACLPDPFHIHDGDSIAVASG